MQDLRIKIYFNKDIVLSKHFAVYFVDYLMSANRVAHQPKLSNQKLFLLSLCLCVLMLQKLVPWNITNSTKLSGFLA